MQLRDIKYFAVVAEHRNVRRASEALDLSPGALSKSLHRLESSMQTKLFERTAKGVELTAVGSALLRRVQRLRLTFEDVAKEAADLAAGRGGHLRIGASPVECDYVNAAFSALLKEAPNVTVQIIDSDNDLMLPALRKGELDLVFNFIGAFDEEIVQEKIYPDELVVCASADHRLAKLKRVRLSDVAKERWVVSNRNHVWAHALSKVFMDHGLPPPRVVMESRSIRCRLQVWSSSDLVGLTSRRMIERAAPHFPIKALSVAELTLPRPIGVMYRKEAYLPPAARRLIELFKTEIRRAN
jgi:DNA-binding transcriptional LysR family regulator